MSVSEFATPSPFLSVAITEAGVRKVALRSQDEDEEDSDDDSDSETDSRLDDNNDTLKREATVINFMLVQPISLQECRIVYDDAFSQPAQPIKKEPTTPTEELKEAADKITLMSPEVFGASSNSSKPKIKEEPASPIPIPTHHIKVEEPSVPKRGAILISGGSSPSREVQDILGDSEAHGGITGDIVITEGTEEEDEDDISDIEEASEDSDELSKVLDNINAKQRVKQEAIDPLSQGMATIRIKEEPKEEKPTLLNIKEEPMLNTSISNPNNQMMMMNPGDMQLIMSRLTDMASLIQTQRAEIQIWREEMKALKAEEKQQVGENNDTLKKIIKSVVGEEMRKATPMMNASLQEALNKDVHGKVLKADLQLKEAVQKMASSKAVVENVANSLASALTPAIHASFKDALTATLVPAFEKSSQNMFVQLSSTFNKGLKEYESQLKTHVNKQLDPVVKDLKDKRAINEMEKKLVSTIKTELRAVNNRSAASPNVASSSPSGPEVQAQIKTKLHEGKVNDAFRLALAAQNLAILVTTCEMVNPDQILNQIPCPLSQEVLLCLIQQLGKLKNGQLKLCPIHFSFWYPKKIG